MVHVTSLHISSLAAKSASVPGSAELVLAFVDHEGGVLSANTAFYESLQVRVTGGNVCVPERLISLYPDSAEAIKVAIASKECSILELNHIDHGKLRLKLGGLDAGQRIVRVDTDDVLDSCGEFAQQQIYTDALTQLGNRRFLDETLSALHATDSTRALTMIMMDLDKFKQVNDTLGHGVGDKLLKRAAKRIKRTARKDDLVIRIGGDEFIILIETEPQSSRTEEVAQQVVEIMSRPFLIDGELINVGASVGIAILNRGTDRVDDLMRHADLALYEAKGAGRGTYRFFKPVLEHRASERRQIEIARRQALSHKEFELRRAVCLKEFELLYQPQVQTASDTLLGFEALICWNSADRGLVSSQDFVSLTEETDEVMAIAEWVMQTACLEAVNWESHYSVAMNVLPIQFMSDRFVDSIKQALSSTGLDPRRLEIEVTESLLVNEPEMAMNHLCAIREMGVGVAMEDFGTGYASLSYLNDFPFSRIKIASELISGNKAEKSHNLVDTIVVMGSSLGINTLAQGVETEEQLERLRSSGCIAVQGPLISAPLPVSELDHFLTRQPGESSSTGTY